MRYIILSIYRIADLNIKIQNKYKYTSVLCKDYLSSETNFDFVAKASDEDISKDRQFVPHAKESYLESLSIYRSICNKLIEYNGFILHASVVEKDGECYAFAAKSGTGKTTHSKLWLKRYPDARIINGDKPLIRFINNKPYVYGTPWCGKENFNINTKSPLKSLCFIERAENNSIVSISKEEAVSRIFSQLLVPEDPKQFNVLLDLVENLINSVSTYLLKCNMDVSAAETAYEKMSK